MAQQAQGIQVVETVRVTQFGIGDPPVEQVDGGRIVRMVEFLGGGAARVREYPMSDEVADLLGKALTAPGVVQARSMADVLAPNGQPPG